MNRAIDALVAEHVMGAVCLHESIGEDAGIYILRFGADFDVTAWDFSGKIIPQGSLPRYSTDIEAGWQVAGTHLVYFSIRQEGITHKTWRCRIDRAGSEAKTAPMAICLAALKAKGVDQSLIEEALKCQENS